MKVLLIAIYLAHGDNVPTLHHKEFASKADCQRVAERMVKRVRVGHARAFCVPLKERVIWTPEKK